MNMMAYHRSDDITIDLMATAIDMMTRPPHLVHVMECWYYPGQPGLPVYTNIRIYSNFKVYLPKLFFLLYKEKDNLEVCKF